MGLLSSIGGALKKAATAVVNSPVGKVLDVATVAFTHPIKTISAIASPEKTVSQVVEQHFAQPLGKQIGETVLATVGYGTAVVSGAAAYSAAAAKGVAGTAAALIPATTKGKIIAAVAAPVVIGAVANQPLKAAEAIAKAPSALANVGGNIANLAANPTLENAANLVKENPVIVGGAAAVAVIAGAKALLPAIATTRQTAAIEEQTEALQGITSGVTVVDKSGEFSTMPYVPATSPATPQTETVKEGGTKTSKKRRKSTSKAVPQNITQKVNVVVQNKSSSVGVRQTKNYLNELVLAS